MPANETSKVNPLRKLYAKSFEHPTEGTMYVVIGIGEEDTTIPADQFNPDYMEVNPEAFDKLMALKDRVQILRAEFIANLLNVFSSFQKETAEILMERDKYSVDYFAVETMARGLVRAHPRAILREVTGAVMDPFMRIIDQATDLAVRRGIFEYIEGKSAPEDTQPEKCEGECGNSVCNVK